MHSLMFSLFFLCLCTSFSLVFLPPTGAETITYAVNQEWVNIWINRDGSVDVLYNLTITYLTGQPQGIITVGMPKSGFGIEYAQNSSGSSLQYQDVSEGNFYGVDVYLNGPIIIGQPNNFIVYAVVPDMVYADETNPGNDGMIFSSSTFSTATGYIASLRVAIVLPEGVQTSEVLYRSGIPFDNVFTQGNNTVVYWERQNWSPAETFSPGVSFPAKYVSISSPASSGLVYGVVAILAITLIAIGVVLGFAKFGKAAYQQPRISVEALGALRGLTAVEAAVVLNVEPLRVLTMILYGLLIKRTVVVTETAPFIKLKKLVSEGETARPTIPAMNVTLPAPTGLSMRYYERDYLDAISTEGTLNEVALARTYENLIDEVNQKLRGHSREDTANYYRSIVNQAWLQVTQAGTPELKGDALDKNLDWLLTDDKFNDRLKTAFPPETIIHPLPTWGWYWGGLNPPIAKSGSSSAMYRASAQPLSLPGQDFANSVVRGLESASNNLVKDIQSFTNIMKNTQASKSQPQQNERGVRSGSSCICACHACACACACVSCACACAGGGAR